MKIILVKVEKALSVNRKYCKGMQPFTKTVKNLLFEFDKLNTCLSKFHMLLLIPEPWVVICAEVAICLPDSYGPWSATHSL